MDVLLSCGSCVCVQFGWKAEPLDVCQSHRVSALLEFLKWNQRQSSIQLCCCCQDIFKLLFYIITEPQKSKLIYADVVAAHIIYGTCTPVCTIWGFMQTSNLIAWNIICTDFSAAHFDPWTCDSRRCHLRPLSASLCRVNCVRTVSMYWGERGLAMQKC